MTAPKPLDVITIGRSSVDLYGAQIGGRLEDMGSFQKYIGGSPTNMAAGTARLGLKSALITRVGDEYFIEFATPDDRIVAFARLAISMLQQAEVGILFRSPEGVKAVYPQFPTVDNFADLKAQILAAD